MNVRSVLIGFIVVTAGCAGTPSGPPAPMGRDALRVRATQSPLIQVSVGQVTGLVPEGWVAAPLAGTGAQHGFIASPRPQPFGGSTLRSGLTAGWVDATEVGVPSDYFYLAATGPLLSELLGREACEVRDTEVFVDREPAYLDGGYGSPGDFVARGRGICVTPAGLRHRWSYFVAAPGFGPVRELGITRSGLYVAA
ncbi:MAG: hypothetical protein WD096_04650, partial [Actinomycetota bacterium]